MTDLLRTEAIRRLEKEAMAGLPPGTLMARAAEALAKATATLARTLEPGRPIIALIGPGNNGGDALLAAVRLREWGYAVSGIALHPGAEPRGDAPGAWRTARAADLPIDTIAALEARFGERASGASGAAAPIVIDGLFGIGLSRPLEREAAGLCEAIARNGWPVVAVDVPSGLDADTGAPVGGARGAVMHARATVTMLADKPGLHTGSALDHVGALTVAGLGVDADTRARALRASSPGDVGRLIDAQQARACRPARRARDSNKGSHGSVLCFGGAPGMRGAALLAARGAQASGAGKVFIGTPEGEIFDAGQPQLMTASAQAPFDRYSAVAIGCGLGSSAEGIASVGRAIEHSRALVLDADALNTIASHEALARSLAQRATRIACVLTPHPLEAARLLGRDVDVVQAERCANAIEIARRFQAVVLLKGAGSVVATPQGSWSIVDAGNPALASAGTGDVLAGMIAAWLARGLQPERAACLAAWLHGRAAEDWARAMGHEEGLSAAELPALVRTAYGSLADPQEDER